MKEGRKVHEKGEGRKVYEKEGRKVNEKGEGRKANVKEREREVHTNDVVHCRFIACMTYNCGGQFTGRSIR